MVITGCVTGDLCAFDSLAGRTKTQVIHRDQDSPLTGLQPIAHIGERSTYNHAHRVGQIAILQLILDRHIEHAKRSWTRARISILGIRRYILRRSILVSTVVVSQCESPKRESQKPLRKAGLLGTKSIADLPFSHNDPSTLSPQRNSLPDINLRPQTSRNRYPKNMDSGAPQSPTPIKLRYAPTRIPLPPPIR